MAADLSGVDQKIARANAQVADLKVAIDETLAASRHRFVLEPQVDGPQHILRVFDIPLIDPTWALLVGEILHNLRSALDHLAWQLIVLDGQQPDDNTYFPVRESPFNKSGQMVGANLHPPVRNPNIAAAVEESQPYRGVQGEPHPFDRSPLWMLHRLNIIDKHRLLPVVATVFAGDDMWWGWDNSWGEPPGIRLGFHPLKDGDPVARFNFHGIEPPRDFDPHPALRVCLYEPTMSWPMLVRSLDDVLHVLARWVEWTLVAWRFRPLFS